MNIVIEKNINNNIGMDYYKEKRLVEIVHGDLHVRSVDETNLFNGVENFNFDNDRVKVLIKVHQSPFHNITHLYGNIINSLKIFDNPFFIINTNKLKPPYGDQKLMEFFYYFLKDNKIDYICVDSDSADNHNMIVNNFYHAGSSENFPIPNSTNNIYDFFNKYVEKKNAIPYKKVYLSRKLVKSKVDYSLTPKGVDLTRIDDEVLLENFFKENGFEIVYPENFKSFEEQINYFNEVKTLVSITGGGAINAMLMPPGNRILELVTLLSTPYNFDEWVEAYHAFFANISFKKNHTYLAIGNHDKKAINLLEKIKNNEIAMNMISQ